jgi:uncharacterized protein
MASTCDAARPVAPDIAVLTREAAGKLIEGFRPPSALVTGSVLDHLDEHMRRFIALSPLCFVSSCDAAGVQEVSPRGDPPGSFKILSERRLAIADRPGNNRVDTLRNLLVNSQLGLIFIIPGVDETLRVSGRGQISVDGDLLKSMSIDGRMPPRLAIVVEVDRAHLHCAKAFRRSRAWAPDGHIARGDLPSFTTMIADQVKLSADKRAEFEARIATANTEGLWEGKPPGPT